MDRHSAFRHAALTSSMLRDVTIDSCYLERGSHKKRDGREKAGYASVIKQNEESRRGKLSM